MVLLWWVCVVVVSLVGLVWFFVVFVLSLLLGVASKKKNSCPDSQKAV